MIDYIPDNTKPNILFTLSYSELRDKYIEYVELRDQEFQEKLPEIIHWSIFVCWVKELNTQNTCGDFGILHLLAHCLHHPDSEFVKTDWKLMRKTFEEQLKLS